MNRRPGKNMTARGFTMLEVVVSGTLLAAVLIVSARMVWSIASQRAAILDRQTAVTETANIMERLFAKPWNDLTQETVDRVQLSADFQRALPSGKLSIELASLPETPPAKKILIKVTWLHKPNQPHRSVQLVALKYEQNQLTE
jgi:Tfp pilus assembly protein PilE